MSSPALDAFKAEAAAQQAELQDDIRGLTDLLRIGDSLKETTRTFVQEELNDRTRRRDRISAALAAVNALANDNYPEVEKRAVPAEVAADLAEQKGDFDAAFAVFEPEATATTLSVDLGAPAEKP